MLADNFFKAGFAAIRKAMEQGIEEGTFRTLDPSLCVLSLISMLLFFFIGRPVLGHVLGTDAYTREGVDAFFNHTMQLYFHGMLQPEDGS